MKKGFSFIVLISFILLNSGCKKNPTEPVETLALSVEDVSCTEAWVEITNSNFQNPSSLTLFVDDKPNQNITLVSRDTILYIDSLLPNQSYKIKAAFASNNRQQTTNEVIAKTLDTTSHNFTWQTFTFGEGSSSLLYDVAIIDENNIWAVGEIHMKDSLGNPDPNDYNVAHWDGTNWEIKRIYFPTVCGQTSLTPYPAKAIFAFDDGQIWISSSGDKIAILKNGVQVNQFCLPWSFPINKMWGTSSSDLYAVGNSGNIAHYDGKSWQKIESGTATDINDIWGSTNSLTNENNIYCAVSNVFEPGDYKILSINKNDRVDSLKWNTGRRVHSVWTNNGFIIYAAGGGVFENKRGYWQEITDIPLYYTRKIRGNGLNDIYAVGDFGIFTHYNGKNWKVYDQLTMNGVYNSVAVNNNLVVATGYANNQAIIVVGRR